MNVTNERRHDLHTRLDEILGREEAATMMDHLPPVGWADVATKTEVRSEVRQLGLELRGEIAGLRTEMHKGQRDLAMTLVGANAAFTGLLFAAITLTN